jgi:YVTN family beta-propeller protein
VLWVADYSAPSLFRLDVRPGTVTARYALPGAHLDVLPRPSGVWVASESGELAVFDPGRHRVTRRITGGADTTFLTVRLRPLGDELRRRGCLADRRAAGRDHQARPGRTGRRRDRLCRRLGRELLGQPPAPDHAGRARAGATEDRALAHGRARGRRERLGGERRRRQRHAVSGAMRRVLAAVAVAAALAGVAGAAGPAQTRIAAGTRPFGVAAAGGFVWAADFADGRVYRIDPRRNRVTGRVAVGGSLYAAAGGGGSLWVGSYTGDRVTRIDPRTMRIVARVRTGSQPIGLAATADAVWVANYGSGSVSRIDPRTNAVVGTIDVGGHPESAVVAAGVVWVPQEEGYLLRIDPAGNAVAARIPVADDPDYAALCGGRVWVTAYRGTAISVVDPGQNAVVARISVASGTQGIACARHVWVANYDRGVLLQLDPQRRKVLRTIGIGLQPRAVVLAAGSVWVASGGSAVVDRVRIP